MEPGNRHVVNAQRLRQARIPREQRMRIPIVHENDAMLEPQRRNRIMDAQRMRQARIPREERMNIPIVHENGAVLEPHCALIRNQAVEQKANLKAQRRAQLREDKKKLLEKPDQNENVKLLMIFPEEIWIVVLNALDCEDQENCTEASGFLHDMLKHTVQFYKTLPNFIKYLRYDDLLNCMIAFPGWRSSVLSVTQNHIQNPCKIVEAEAPFQGQFKFVELEIDTEFVEKYKTFNSFEISVNANGQNSELSDIFSGKNVTLIASYHPQFFSEFVSFLSARCHQIQYLTLIGKEISISPAMLYMLCQQILQSCKSLKELTVKGWRFVNWTDPESDIIGSVLAQPPLMDHKNLEELILDLGHPLSLVIVERMMEKYAKQLKHASVTILEQPYYQIYNNFEFSSLSEICATHGNIKEVFELLNQINAPNLQKLTVTLDKSAPKLNLFLSVIWKFPKLCMLDLRVSVCFKGWLNREILNVPPTKCAGHYLQKLKITALYVLYGNEICLDFLICFPHLKQLHFVSSEIIVTRNTHNWENLYRGANHGHVEDHPDFAITETELPNNAQVDIGIIAEKINQQIQANNNLLTEPDVEPEAKRSSKNDLIRLRVVSGIRRSSGEKYNVHASNIWEILPSLQTIRCSEYMYSREKWNLIRLDFATALEDRISLIQHEVEKRNKEKSLKTRDSFKNANITVQKNLLAIIAKTRSFISDELWESIQECIKVPQDILKFPELAKILEDTKTQTHFLEVFPIIFSKLSKSDILKCRMVCKQWTTAVDQFLESIPSTHEMVPVQKNLPQFLETFRFWYPVQIPSKLKSVSELMRQHSRNPFISRSVELFVASATQLEMHFDASMAKYIWHVKITFPKSLHINPVEYFQLCLKVVKTFPNLKFLYIGKAKIDRILHNQNKFEFKSGLKIIPPLSTLIVHSCDNIQHVHWHLLSLFWPQLKRLVVDWKDTYRFTAPPVCMNRTLEEMEIPVRWGVNIFESLKSVHLKYLCIELRENMDDAKFLSIFGGIINTGLQTLKISVYNSFNVLRKTFLVRVHPTMASSVTELILTVENVDTFSFDMLILFPFLRRLILQIKSWARGPESANDYVQFKKFLCEDDDKLAMYKSNVWQFLPYIELIKILVQDALISKIFTRTEYNALNVAENGGEIMDE